MIKHIVAWRLKAFAHGNDKAKNARLIKEKLEGLKCRIPGLLAIEAGIDFSNTKDSGDIVLYTEFESRQALDNYQSHPAHKEIMPFIMEAREERRIVDYEP